MTNFGTRLFSPRLFGMRLFRGGPPYQIGGGAGDAEVLAPSRADDHEAALRRRLLEDDETLIFAIAAWAASRRLH